MKQQRADQTGKINGVFLVIALGFISLALAYPHFTARGQGYGQINPVTTPIVVPTDVTSPQLVTPGILMVPNSPTAFALAGVQLLSDSQFPASGVINQNVDWITVKFKEGSVFTKPNEYTVNLQSGQILVSVKAPSKIAFVETPFGLIALAANNDALISFENGVLRILNLDGEGTSLKAQLNKGPFGGPADPTVTVACGYELVASENKITRAELRPRDGIARRFSKVLENGHLAVSEFSVETAMSSNSMIVDLQQKSSGAKERRCLSDMSKMAAVLNFKHGTEGFAVEK